MIGDDVEHALARVGITEERIAELLGAPCDCEGRKRKLNALHAWARRRWVDAGSALSYLERLLCDGQPE